MKTISILLGAVIIFISCQKTSNNQNQINQTNNSSNGKFYASNSIDGLKCNYDYSAQAVLPTPCTCGTKVGYIGTVSANGHSIAFVQNGSYTNYGIYTDAIINQYNPNPNPGQISGTVKWAVSGANGIAGFNYTTNKQMPVLPAFYYDTIHRQHSYTINHPTITADSIIYEIGDNGVHVNTWLVCKKTNSSSSVTFSQTDVQNMNFGTNVFWPATTRINIIAKNTSYYNGHVFVNVTTYSDYITVVNN